MSNCNEFLLDDMMAITAIPVSDISAGEISSPLNCLAPTIYREDFQPSLANAITIGRDYLYLPTGSSARSSYLVPVLRGTGEAKDDTGDSVAGRLHTVTVNCEIDERGGEIWAPIEYLADTPCSQRLERTPHHLPLSFRDGKLGFVAATEDTYLCTIERDGAKVSVSFKIQNLMGIQLLV